MAKPRTNSPGGAAARAQRVRATAPCVETRSRTILAAMVEEAVAANPELKLPDVPEVEAAPAGAASVKAEGEQGIDDMKAEDLAAIAQHGASLEIDGARFSSEELTMLAGNVSDQAHLKIANSGTFTREELSTIALSAPGQVIFA